MFNRRSVFSAIAGAGVLTKIGNNPVKADDDTALRGRSKLKLHYGTNRNMIGDHEDFGPEFGWKPNDPNYYSGIIEIDEASTLDAAIADQASALKIFRASTATNSKAMIQSFLNDAVQVQASSAGQGLQSLVFIHGYAFKFNEVGGVARVVAAGYGSKANLFFSWPSYGDHMKYGDDWDHAYGSGTATGQFLLDLLTEVNAMASPPRLSLVCHSMGNRVLSSTMQYLKGEKNFVPKKYFDYILLFAADESYEALNDEDKLTPALGMFKNSMTVYTNGDDLALLAGQHHPKNRIEELGRDGPKYFPIADKSGEVRKDIFWVNCQRVADSWIPTLGHQYYRLSPAVIKDAESVLSGMDGSSIPGRSADNFVVQKFNIEK